MTREEAIKEINKHFPSSSCGKYEELRQALNMAIEALSEVRCNDCKWNDDVIEVVRCKDCRYLEVINGKVIYAKCNRHAIIFEPFEDDTRNNYCSWGERAEQTDKGGDSDG